jgi:hypothetical protein
LVRQGSDLEVLCDPRQDQRCLDLCQAAADASARAAGEREIGVGWPILGILGQETLGREALRL